MAKGKKGASAGSVHTLLPSTSAQLYAWGRWLVRVGPFATLFIYGLRFTSPRPKLSDFLHL